MRIPIVLSLGVLCAAVLAGCTQKYISTGPITTGPGTTAAARQYLEGRWTLVSYEIYPTGRPPVRLIGTGTLTYDEYSNLNMEVRTDPQTAETLRNLGITTNNGVLVINGRTAVDMQQRTLTYVVDGQPLLAAMSGPLDPRRPRHWTVEGNALTLTTNGDDGKPSSTSRWEKQP